MKFRVEAGNLEKEPFDCLIIGVLETGETTQPFDKIDKMTKGALKEALTRAQKEQNFHGKIGQSQMIYHLPTLKQARILLVGCGKTKTMPAKDYRHIVLSSTKTLIATDIRRVNSFLT